MTSNFRTITKNKITIQFHSLFLVLCLCNLTGISAINAQNGIPSIRDLIKEKKYQEGQEKISSLLETTSLTDSAIYIEVQKLQANLYYRTRQYQSSINTNNQLLSYLPSGHPEIGACHFENGRNYLRLADYQNFTISNQKAATAFASSFGKDAIEYTKALNSLGFGHQVTGAYKDSEKVLEEARKIKEKNKVYDMQYARIINQLGKTYTVLNKFQEAEECIVTSLKIKEKLRGRNRDYGRTQAYYADLLQSIGRFEDGIQQIDEALAISSNRKGDNLNYKQIKATLLHGLEQKEEAAILYEEIKTERAASETEKSSNYAKILFDLSSTYLDLSESEKALTYVKEAETIFEKLHSNNHPYYAMAIRKKAEILLDLGREAGLEDLYKTSSRIIARKYSKKHIEYFKSEYAYFRYLKKNQNYTRAISKMEQIDDVITNFIIDASKYLSIQEIIEITNLYHEYFQEILSLTSLNPDNQVLTAKAFDCSLFYKGFVLEALLSIKKTIRQSKVITELSEQLTELKIHLSAELDKTQKDSEKMASIQDQIDIVEIDIARNLGRLRQENERMSWDLLQYELSANEAVIDFVRYSNAASDEKHYAAMILLPDADAPVFVSLFLESDITKYFKGKLTNSKKLIARLYQYADRGVEPAEALEEISLYDLIWEPIASHLDGIEKVYYVCDGILHNIALHAIPTDLETVVSDSISLLQMTSFRNLIRSQSSQYIDEIKKALLIGGVHYGEIRGGASENRSGWQHWRELRWTALEVDEISAMMQKENFSHDVLKGVTPQKNTLREKLKYAEDYQLIHFATHGFFATNDLLDVKSKVKINQANLELARSGLVLAKANELRQQDALLTAFEISELDLTNTELVVLSACETGLGQVYEYEGVYGMQRAFKIAGAEYIIMSLWQVPDRETKVFMTEFYRNYLEEGLSIPEAFDKTQKKLKDNLLDPVKWAGFVLLK